MLGTPLFIRIFLVLSISALIFPQNAAASRVFKSKKSDQAKGYLSPYQTKSVTHRYKQFSQYIKMSDGTRLAVEVYLPGSYKLGDKLPTMVEESRYWRVRKKKILLYFFYPI